MEVDIGFSMLKKQRTKHRRGQDMSKKSEHDKVEKKETCRKSKEMRKKTEEKEEKKRGQNCTLLPGKRLRSILYFSYQLLEAFFAFQAFLYTLLGGL